MSLVSTSVHVYIRESSHFICAAEEKFLYKNWNAKWQNLHSRVLWLEYRLTRRNWNDYTVWRLTRVIKLSGGGIKNRQRPGAALFCGFCNAFATTFYASEQGVKSRFSKMCTLTQSPNWWRPVGQWNENRETIWLPCWLWAPLLTCWQTAANAET